MLSALHIKNYVLIDSLDVTFPEGLVIITGQTGAGKSILLGALSLLMGAKADAGVIMEGADNCVVEAEFDIPDGDGFIRGVLDENEADWCNGKLIIRRVVNASGRSRSFLNDSPVQVGVLAAISSRLVDIHSQHQSLMLTDHNFQLSILDYFAGNGDLLRECRDAYRELQSLKSERLEIIAHMEKLSLVREYNEAQLRQLEAARLRPGELEALEAEQKQLANAEQIKGNLSGVKELFSPEADSGTPIIPALKESARLLSKVREYVPEALQLETRMESCRIELDDIISEIEDIFGSINLSEERLQQVEERMSLIYGLLKKHGCASEEELLSLRDYYANALLDSDNLKERLESLNADISECGKRYSSLADALHVSRLGASSGFETQIQDSIHFLELERAVFKVVLNPAQDSASGRDAISFTFSASGKNPVDVTKCASGGEISRIMLCLKALMAKYAKMPTMIFDEIDTGVSGSVADKMGSMICRMGEDMQVFAITHLPQVAAKGCAHYLVSKQSREKTTSTMNLLDTDSRILELARMLSGSSVTEAAIANAKALLFQ